MTSQDQRKKVGTIAWRDLTVADAESVRDFYKSVVGWDSEPVSMGEYNDFNMIPPGNGEAIAGICHARGGNSELPAQWLLYILVEDLDASIQACTSLGGEIVSGPREMGADRYCVIRDPAGAVCALYQSA